MTTHSRAFRPHSFLRSSSSQYLREKHEESTMVWTILLPSVCLMWTLCTIYHKYLTVRSCPFQLSRHLLCTQDNGSMQLWCQLYYHHLDSTSNTSFVTIICSLGPRPFLNAWVRGYIIWKATNTSSRRQLPLHRTGFPSLPHLYLGRAMPVWGQDWNHTTPYRGSLVEHFE